jgi:hypothetical protein
MYNLRLFLIDTLDEFNECRNLNEHFSSENKEEGSFSILLFIDVLRSDARTRVNSDDFHSVGYKLF